MELNAPQHQAVMQTEGPLLVFAGAGSGKTRVITFRVANLLANHRVPPYRILCVTFTNRAAGEMKERLIALAGPNIIRDLWVGTFHSICCRLLRKYHEEVGLERSFVIYDAADQKAMMKRVIRHIGLDERLYPPKAVLARIHSRKQQGLSPRDIEPDYSFDAEHLQAYEAYETALRTANAVDFDDLIVHVTRIAESKDSAAGKELRQRFDFLMVDEFQDTNGIQYRLVRALAAASQNICVVGDDDQSIYSWRGADVRNIRGFQRDFPDAQVVKLEQNYRSSGNIVAAALSIIQPAETREPKELWTEQPAGDLIGVSCSPDERAEAAFVVGSAKAELARGVSPDEIAVFYRINAQSRVLEEAFRNQQIPYQIVGGMKFFERAEVKDAMSYLRLVDNPHSDADLVRVINTPARGIGTKTIEQVLSFGSNAGCSALTGIPQLIEKKSVGTAARKRLAGFLQLIEELREASTQLSPSELASEILSRTGYRKLLRDADSAEADARLENLEEFVGSIQEYEQDAEQEGEEVSVAGYLERVSLVADIDQVDETKSVLLMTVHSSKGLEFESVYLTGMEEETFPYRGLDAEKADELEEERRLAYVAVTRARQRLQITYVSTRTLFGRTEYRRPSRFLEDIPESLTKHEGGHWAPRRRSTPTFDEYSQVLETESFATNTRHGLQSYPKASPARLSRPAQASGSLRSGRTPLGSPPLGASKTTSREDGGPTVDYDAFNDLPIDVDAIQTQQKARQTAEFEQASSSRPSRVHKGQKVYHKRFGTGVIQRVDNNGVPQVVARFPGFGDRKVLASYLRFE